jgi:hypothetical protein
LKRLRLVTLLAVLLAAAGLAGADAYASLLRPVTEAILEPLARRRGWRVERTYVGTSATHGSALFVEGEIPPARGPDPGYAVIRGWLNTGAIAQTPVVFLLVLVGWPSAGRRELLARLAVGLPALALVDTVNTAAALAAPFASAEALRQGDAEPATAWNVWVHFNEAGGRVMLAAVAAVLVIAALRRASAWRRERRSRVDQKAP